MSQYSMKTYDHATLLKEAGLVAASAAGSIILDLGNGFMEADLIIDISALEVAGGDEIYTISLEGSAVAAMTSGSVELAKATFGNNPAPADADTAVGRHMVPITNELNGTLYRYVRLYTTVAGVIATGINYSAFLAKK
ncbi:MAG: hypothetical protein WC026_16160 [Hyphomicrobium sp.]|uniref:hypothetical protein n=1 Tax=Hyphomicrobium sp. TaxID=82 RepID=UPI0035622AFE